MDQSTRAEADQAIEILAPARQTAPVVYSSPHSGSAYPPSFLATAALDPLTLRRSEDCFVDELFAHAPHTGAPLLKALFPRAFIDPNREPYELDPAMFADRLPDFVNRRSPRVAAGLGTIARVVASGAEIYADKLDFTEAKARIDGLYRPYHAALEDLIATTHRQFGFCILVDCHSMPSVGGPMENDAGRRRQVDMILGDGHGTTCAPALMSLVEASLRDLGYTVVRNTPYSGGYITRNYGRPEGGVHALQIEINRALYMDEARYVRKASMARLVAHLKQLCTRLGSADYGLLAA
jgi:N-formylglutamate amidohydrolase